MEGKREIEGKTNSEDGLPRMDTWETATDTLEMVIATSVRPTAAAESCKFVGFPSVAGTLLN